MQNRLTLRTKAWLQLGLLSTFVAVVWLVALPWCSQTGTVARRLDWLEAKRIDPSAMFYTELDCVDHLLIQESDQKGR